jgi:hypothetical protein
MLKNFVLIAVLGLGSSVALASGAAPLTCAYSLDGEAYVGKDDGDLRLNGRTYRCETYRIGVDEKTLCKARGSRSKDFAFVVAFDGAENDFFVFDGIDSTETVCHSVATSKTDK